MERYEYKTLALDYGHGWFKRKDPDLEGVLNDEAKDGWRLRELVVPAKDFGASEKFLIVLERKVQA